MLFVFSVVGTETFWMHGMRFPIDIIWVRTCRIVGLSQDLPPPTLLQVIFPASLPVYPSPAPIDMAIEVGAGTARELGLKIGDVVIFSQGG